MRAERGDVPMMGLRGLVLWLAVGTLLWYRLIGWPPPALPPLPTSVPSWATVDVWLRSPLAADWTGFVAIVGLVGWVFWAWAWASVLLEVGINLADAATKHAAWVVATRAVLRPLTVPFIRRTVDASLSGLLLARIVLQPVVANAAVPWQADVATVAPANPPLSVDVASANPPLSTQAQLQPRMSFTGEMRVSEQPGCAADGEQQVVPQVLYHVQPGDSLWSIARLFYGDGKKDTVLFDANVGRVQADGRALTHHGVIEKDWIIQVPQPTNAIELVDGQWWYTVQPGDTLSGISARLLGDPSRSGEIFQLNRGAAAPDGHILVDPNLIWPELRLLIPLDEPVIPAAQDSPPAPTQAVPSMVADQADRGDRPSVEETPEASPTAAPTESATTPATPEPTRIASPTPAPFLIQPMEHVPTDLDHPLPPAAAALGAAGLAAAALAASRLVVYKRKPGRDPDGPESDVPIRDGFAEIDPVEDLTRRTAHTSDPASAIASLLGQAYAATFDEQLQPDERHTATYGASVAATRHGRTSTTLVVAAPVAARPYFVHHMRAAAERAFGSQVDTDGLVGQDGDALVRITWDPRRPTGGQLLERVGNGAMSAWPAPCLVPALLLYDRQRLAINWHTLGNVLVAAPTGQGADVPLVALVAALASVRAPEDLGLVVIARRHSLPDEIDMLLHGLHDVVDPAEPEMVLRVLDDVKAEIDRRREAGSRNEADLVVVVREVADLEPEAMATAAVIAATGPDFGVRLLVASERPAVELLRTCPFVDQLGTRLVLQTATEEDSVALLGMDGAEDLGAGGHALLRLEGRIPYRGWAHRVSADNLARLVHMMGARAPAVAALAPEVQPTVADGSTELEAPETGEHDSPEVPTSQDDAPVAGASVAQTNSTVAVPASKDSPLLQRLRSAPIRVRCFGARSVWYGDRLVEIADPQLLLLLAIHPVTGIQSEALVDMLWDRPPTNVGHRLRRKRHDLRVAIQQVAPELASVDAVPGNQIHGEKEIALDVSIVSSDVHEFTELLRLAEKREPAGGIQAYESALALYKGDLLDSSDMPNYRWMYDEDPQVGLTLRSDFRRQHREARLRLAELLARGPEDGLARAEELYSSLCAEDVYDEQLWIALFRIHEHTGSLFGLDGAVRRLRNALVELGATDVTDIDRVPLPDNLERIVNQIRSRIGGGRGATTGCGRLARP